MHPIQVVHKWNTVTHVQEGEPDPVKRRGGLTVWGWTVEVLGEWFTEIRPLFGADETR
ncbi:hypothetical protein [Nocardia donostiensis]|uniref:hypothetical protein n=1 Tax=Nocardia donostiensis TaxID=1538463 RepID=UPI001589C023|nr:hypothetical protein [Nocardia donostiensis]